MRVFYLWSRPNFGALLFVLMLLGRQVEGVMVGFVFSFRLSVIEDFPS